MTDDPAPHSPDKGKRYWLDSKRNVELVFWILCLICAALFLSDLFYHRHVDYDMESYWGAYGIFGFVCFVGIVYAGIGLRKLVMRDEDYYDR